MISEINELLRCKAIIEDKLGWGKAESWQTADFDNLSELILKETGVSLSTSTLRRIWGRTEYNHLPSGTTLNTLARFAGSEDWRAFVRQHQPVGVTKNKVLSQAAVPITKNRLKQLVWTATGFVALILVGTLAFDSVEPQLEKSAYSFESRSVTRGIPNSVIFTYDATASPTDSVFIQQSWDATKRALVNKSLHKYTAIYYEPGTYQAKLLVGKQVVKEHKLVVGTNGWTGLIEQPKVPVYLKRDEFLHSDHIGAGTRAIEKKNISLQPDPPLVKYFNVGNFEPIAIDDFSFSCELKNEYSEGAAACQLTYISLLTDDMPIVIPLSANGCVSELNLMSIDHYLSGKKADLSALGISFSKWVQVSCASSKGKIRYLIDDKQAFEFPVPSRPIKILGVEFGFRGTGSVRKIRLQSKNKPVFTAW